MTKMTKKEAKAYVLRCAARDLAAVKDLDQCWLHSFNGTTPFTDRVQAKVQAAFDELIADLEHRAVRAKAAVDKAARRRKAK